MPKLDYYNRTPTGLSYSRLKLLAACPRKYELETFHFPKKDYGTTPTFAFGHMVAGIIQGWFVHTNTNRAVVHGSRLWDLEPDHDYEPKDWKNKKTFYHAILAGQEFIRQIQRPDTSLHAEFDGWEIAQFNLNGRSFNGEELTFVAELEGDYTYEGHIDLVLWHPELRRFKVVEIKTTAYREPDDALYVHSEQAIGYTIMLDRAAELMGEDVDTAYDVTYLIYSTSMQEFIVRNYHKTPHQRQSWLNWLAFNVGTLETFKDSGVEYPTNGGSCYQWNRACKHIDNCARPNSMQCSTPDFETYTQMAEEDVDFKFTFEELVDSQQRKLDSADSTILTTQSATSMLDIEDIL